MTEEEAAHLSKTLKGLLPSTTVDQAFLLKREFLKFDASIVESAIDAHAKIYPQVNIPRLLEQIRDASPGPNDAAQRTGAERRRVEEENNRIAAALSRLSETELRRCADEAIAAAEPGVRRFLQKSDPQTSAVLRSLMYQRLQPLASTDLRSAKIAARGI